MSTTPFSPDHLQDDAGWAALLRRLPADLDHSAFQELALFRHRQFATATLLLRLLLAYACGVSMPLVTAWAAAHRWVSITPEALHYRLKQAHHWMAALVLHLLTHRAQIATAAVAACRTKLRLIDGTTTPRPGATGTDWRIHCSLDLRTFRLDDVQVTPETEGETFTRFTPQVGEVWVGDRNFGTRAGVWHAIRHGADVLVRFIITNFPLQTPAGEPFPLWEALRTLTPATAGEWAVQTKPRAATRGTSAIPALPGRLIVYRLSPEAALQAQARHRRYRSRNQDGPPGAATVAGWEYVVLFTTLSAVLFPTGTVLALYRFRWQIELAIKRYKSLCGLARVRTRHTACCQTVLWAKLLLILLQEDLGGPSEVFPPGAGGCHPCGQPMAVDQPLLDDLGGVDLAATRPMATPGAAAGVGELSHRHLDPSPTSICSNSTLSV